MDTQKIEEILANCLRNKINNPVASHGELQVNGEKQEVAVCVDTVILYSYI